MKSIWFKPEEYQRTSQQIQYKCLEQLLGFTHIEGSVCDIGCGTGNSLSILSNSPPSHYVGIDISPDMLDFAKKKHAAENITFIESDFLREDLVFNAEFDCVICAACLHWFIPNEKAVIEKAFASLKPGGKFLLSCAFDFDYFFGQEDIQRNALGKVREKYHSISPLILFDDYRFDSDSFLGYINGFIIRKSMRIEESIEFTCYEDFRDWHVGSGSVIYHQFSLEDQNDAVNDFYTELYNKYACGDYEVAYSTGLFYLQKR